MTTAAAWQRTINELDPEAFGELVADDVLATAAELLGDDDGAGYTIGRDDLRVMLGMAALGGFRRLIDAVQLEYATGDPIEDDPAWDALGSTVGVARQAVVLLDHDDAPSARALLADVVDAWDRNTGSTT